MSDQISVHEMARLLGVSSATAYKMLRSGDVEATQWRGRWIISRTAVQQLMTDLGLKVNA